jgi:hypothetical protein
MHASWLTSSRPSNFFNKGCFNGSFEYLHNSSGLRRLADDSVFVSVLLGGGLKLYQSILMTIITIKTCKQRLSVLQLQHKSIDERTIIKKHSIGCHRVRKMCSLTLTELSGRLLSSEQF